MQAPVFFDLANDNHAARFGLNPWERDYLMTRCFPNRNGGSVQGIALHIDDGRAESDLDWWINGPGVEASSHYIVRRDGSVIRVIPEAHGAWTNGKVTNPDRSRIGHLLALGGNLNNWCITIEAECRTWESLTEAQFASILWLCRDIMHRYPAVELRDIFGHYTVDSADRSRCGRYDLQVIAALGDDRDQAETPAPSTHVGWGTVVHFDRPTRVLVTASAGVNVRQWAETKPYSKVLDVWPAGREFFASGFIVGENVAGEDRWYIDVGGRRVWSGATNKAMLRP